MDKKVLVAYFSVTGETERKARDLADEIGADLFEIKPAVPYTREDLDWTNKNSRTSVEMASADSRPAIASRVKNMEQYDVIFLGFPIWWYTCPSIIYSFLDGYDFRGKTIVPFATSGGSQLGSTPSRLQSHLAGAVVKNGRTLNGRVSPDELKDWADRYLSE